MRVLRAYKTELDPTYRQVEQLLQHAGCARYAYNWGLRKKIEAYKATGKSPSAIDLHRELNALKAKPQEEGGVPWMYESSRFKSRKNGIGSFRLTGSIRATETHVQLPVLGELRLKERGYLPVENVKVRKLWPAWRGFIVESRTSAKTRSTR